MFFQYENLYNIHKTNWLEFYILLGNLSKSIRTNDKSLDNILIQTFFHVLCFAKQNEIDMFSSWNRWKIKCDFKNYST